MNPVFALCISILIGIGGQLLFKTGAMSEARGIAFFLNPLILLAFAGYGVSALLYIYSLREIPIGIAYPSLSISYFIVAYLAHLIWNEAFGWYQIGGLVFIGIGTFLVSRVS